MTEIQLATTDVEIKACYPVMQQLRPAYSEVTFLAQIKKQIQAGYHLAYLSEGRHVWALAGYRYSECLAWGTFLYVDDLITDSEQRSKGYGKLLLEWLIQQAKSHKCAQLHLDSGVQRLDAHRFYEAQGMVKTGYHYAMELK